MNKFSIAAILISGVALAACGGGGETSRGPTTPDPVTPTPTPGPKPTITNPNYTRYIEPAAIKRDLSGLASVYRKNYHKFLEYKAPNGKPIRLVATNDISDEQLLRSYNILSFYLSDVPGSKYGKRKAAVANQMANSGAVLVMAGGADGASPIKTSALAGQPLYQLEFPAAGTKAYLESDYDQRDAGFEEIFHMVHDNGIGTKYTPGVLKSTYQSDITKAMENAYAKGIWKPDRATYDEWKKEGSLEQEYIASVIDSYYGYWGAWTGGTGGMWGLYKPKTRADVKRLDPQGAKIVEDFLAKDLTYMARIDPNFKGTFKMAFDASAPYTHKSQYLNNARLLGSNDANLIGNDRDNILMGNAGRNTIDGRGGMDVVQYTELSKFYEIRNEAAKTIVSSLRRPNDVDTLINVEIIRFPDKDVKIP